MTNDDPIGRIKSAILALPSERRPYSLRHAPDITSTSLGDLLTDLAPFILAETQRTEPVKPRALSTVAGDAAALAEEVAHRATIRRGPGAAEDAVKLQIAARLIAEVANAPARALRLAAAADERAAHPLRVVTMPPERRCLAAGPLASGAVCGLPHGHAGRHEAGSLSWTNLWPEAPPWGPEPTPPSAEATAHRADMARLWAIFAVTPDYLDAQQTAEVRAIVARMFAPEADGAAAVGCAPSTGVLWNDPTHPADPLRDLRDAQRANPDPFTAIMVAKLEADATGAEGDRSGDVRLCVAALVTDPEARVLLVQSSKPGRGWELPGGGVEHGESPGYAAVREVREETGIEISELHTVPTEIHGTVKPGAAYRSRIALYRATAEGEPRAGDDALGAGWFTARQVQKLSQHGLLSDLDTRPALLSWAGRAP